MRQKQLPLDESPDHRKISVMCGERENEMGERDPAGADPSAAIWRWTTVRVGLLLLVFLGSLGGVGRGEENVYLLEVPDYEWYGGCYGTASGNLIGHWDRRGLPNLYKGPTAGGVAPLNSVGPLRHILGMWSTKPGRDGRPIGQLGHEDNYWDLFESTLPDPYVRLGRAEHPPDCIGDFIGLSQRKWVAMNGECDGNVDGYAFNYFDPSGARRVNFQPKDGAGNDVRDVQSGLRAFARFRGYEVETFSQLTDFNTMAPLGRGFGFEDLKAEIDAGYPVLLHMQNYAVTSRTLGGVPGVNPNIHAMLAYGYVVTASGRQYVRYRTSWASGDTQFSEWLVGDWTPGGPVHLPIRGVIGFHPRPKVVEVRRVSGGWRVEWEGPMGLLRDELADAVRSTHWYVVEAATEAGGPYRAVTEAVETNTAVVAGCCEAHQYFRVRLVSPPRDP